MRSLLFAFALLVPAVMVAAPLKEPVTFDSIKAWVENQPTATLNDALGALPESMRRNGAWIKDSSGGQTGDEENPRGIVYSPSGKLALAFTGMPGDSRREVLEMLQFDEKSASFQMRAIDFSKKPPKVSEANPPECLRCHGKDPRPNWNAYPQWKDAYGVTDFEDDAAERKKYSAFASAKEKDPRYGHFFLKERETFPEKKDEKADERASRLLLWQRSYLTLPNSRLTDFFAAMNFQRLVRLATGTSLGDKIVPAMAVLLGADCKIPTADLFPEEWKPYADDLEKAFENYKKNAPNDITSVQSMNESLQLVRIFAASLGVATADWTMNFDRSHPTFGTPSFAERGFVAALLPKSADVREVYEIEKAKDELHGGAYLLPTVVPKGNEEKNCEKLAAASRKNLKGIAMPKFVAVKAGPKAHK